MRICIVAAKYSRHPCGLRKLVKVATICTRNSSSTAWNAADHPKDVCVGGWIGTVQAKDSSADANPS